MVVLFSLMALLFFYKGPAIGTAAAADMELSLATYSPVAGAHYEGLKYLSEEVEKRSNGKVKIRVFWGETLAKAREIPDAVRMGTADMGHWISRYHPKLIPFWSGSVAITNGMGKGRPFYEGISTKGYQAYQKVCSEFPEVAHEFDNINQKILGAYCYYEEYFIMRKPIYHIDEFKGQRIRSYGALLPAFYKSFGAVPVSITSTEAYDGLLRGVVDGAITSVESAYKYKYYERAKYLVDLTAIMGAHPFNFPITINRDLWAKLSPEVQKLLATAVEDSIRAFDKASARVLENGLNEMKEKGGVKLIKLPQKEIDALQPKAQEIFIGSYLKILESVGYKRDKVMEVIKRWTELAY